MPKKPPRARRATTPKLTPDDIARAMRAALAKLGARQLPLTPAKKRQLTTNRTRVGFPDPVADTLSRLPVQMRVSRSGRVRFHVSGPGPGTALPPAERYLLAPLKRADAEANKARRRIRFHLSQRTASRRGAAKSTAARLSRGQRKKVLALAASYAPRFPKHQLASRIANALGLTAQYVRRTLRAAGWSFKK